MADETDEARAKAAANEARLEALRVRYRKIGVILWDEHEIVWRLPTRDELRNYRRMRDSPIEAPDALESLSQVTIAAFDGDDEPNAARIAYTGTFLVEYPGFCSSQRVINCLHALAGLVSNEEAIDLGKGVSVRSYSRAPTPKG